MPPDPEERPLRPAVAERLLHLAAYLKREASNGRAVALENITDDLPDYAGGNYEGVRKKLRRDLTELEESFGIGVDVSDEGEYRLRDPFLGTDERRALFAAAAAVHVDDDLRLRPGDLAGGVDSDDASVWMYVHRMVRALTDAIAERRTVEFVHDGVPRSVEPWALGHWRRRWYLVGRDRDRGEIRRFRLDRIEEEGDGSVTSVGPPGSYEIPEEFEPAKAFDLHPDAWGHDPPARARLLVDRQVAGPLATQLQGAVTGEEGDRLVVEAEIRHYDAFVDRILAAGDRAVVVEPPVLVERVRDHLRGLVES
ncbi:MAG: WYL domain-containing protein [Acidimicrobiia bacterium]|nr:WYL domain-containing protein [Acidimicrobiia bacterium]